MNAGRKGGNSGCIQLHPVGWYAKHEQNTVVAMRTRTLFLLIGLLAAVACTPTVKVEAPDKPIEINMNINIKHEILIRVEKEVEQMFEEEDDLF